MPLNNQNIQLKTQFSVKEPDNKKNSWYIRCCGPKKIHPLIKRNSTKAKDLGVTFCEHTWDIHQIQENYHDSNIDIHNPAKSKGLTQHKADQLFQSNGPNSLEQPKEITNFQLFISQFWNLLWVLLTGAATLSLIQFFFDVNELVNLWITLIIYGMIVVMCTVSWYQEMEARKAVRGFENLLPELSLVIRNGVQTTIGAHNLVVGDIIIIKNGTRVPADARILQCNQLKLETSSITGEAEPVDFHANKVLENVNIFESHNIAFNGSLCVDGEGIALVIRVAKNTVIGQIANLTTNQKAKQSRLEMQIAKYVKFLVVLACSVATIAFIIAGFLRNWVNMMPLFSNGFLVCAIGMVPCGLPATVTSILSLLARKLSRKNVYLKRLDICEALGQVNIIASDKTGTLTMNIMTVTNLWFWNEIVNGVPQSNATDIKNKSINNYETPISDMLECMSICNSAHFRGDEKNQEKKSSLMDVEFTRSKSGVEKGRINNIVEKQLLGTPSDVAMLKYSDSIIDIKQLRKKYNIVFEIPFNSNRKWQMIIAKMNSIENGQHEYKLFIKGASEILAKKCSKILTKNGVENFDQQHMEIFQDSYTNFAQNGRRVIGFAQKTFVADSNIIFSSEDENYPTDNFVFIGTSAIMDPPRENTAASIADCKRAGIKVFMVTGDHHLTATAIGRQIGLIVDKPGQQPNYEIIEGEKIFDLTDSDWDKLVEKESLIFARTTPEQKLLIVEQCQKRQKLIAMTGDGVNDAPALKRADIGIAMGSGSEVAKQASDIILMDDNFSSIVGAVQEGRVMYDNIKKLLAYTMPHSFPEVWPIIINFCFGWPVGITALQILAIDLGSEILPGVSMSREKIEGDVMQRPPRAMKKVLVSNSLLAYSYTYTGQILSLGCLLSYFYVFWSHGINIGDLWMSALKCWQKNGEIFYSNGRAFSVDEQLLIGRQATSAWQMGIVFGQFFNIWSARTRRISLFKHGLFTNKHLLAGITCEFLLIYSYVYISGLNEFLGGASIPYQCWFIVAGVGLFIFCYNEIRKLFIRKWPKNRYVRWFKY